MTGWSLAALSVVCGLGIAWVFGRLTDHLALKTLRRRLQANLLEIRLFSDDPRLVWRAQLALFRDNLRLIALLLRPMLVLLLPMAWLLLQLDSVYGTKSLEIGQPAVVTAQMATALTPQDAASILAAPPGIAVETPPVRSFADRQISWRVRPIEPVRGSLRLTLRGKIVEKTIEAGDRGLFLSRRRAHSLYAFLTHVEEARITDPDVAWLDVDYPGANVRIAGIALPWPAWFLLISSASAWIFARRLRLLR